MNWLSTRYLTRVWSSDSWSSLSIIEFSFYTRQKKKRSQETYLQDLNYKRFMSNFNNSYLGLAICRVHIVNICKRKGGKFKHLLIITIKNIFIEEYTHQVTSTELHGSNATNSFVDLWDNYGNKMECFFTACGVLCQMTPVNIHGPNVIKREAFPHTWVSSNDNFLKSISNFQSIAELF